MATTSHLNYPRLRTRLLDEFVDVGTSQGQSQPATSRDPATGMIRWADSTIQLGFYIGMLATEYAILDNPDTHPDMNRGGGTIRDTREELHHALAALERLDAVADLSFDSPCTQTEQINGFFIRDDIPEEAWNHFPGTTTVRSDYVDPIPTQKEMSQDQVYHLLSGLALVRRFVPTDVTVESRGLADWATDLALGIIDHTYGDGSWQISNPACDDREVDRGPNASGYALATSAVGTWFSDGAVVLDYPAHAETLAELGRDPGAVFYLEEDNLHMAMTVFAAGNAWEDTTTDDLMGLAESHGWVIYPLLHQALHGPTQAWCDGGHATIAAADAMLEELSEFQEPASPWPDTTSHGFTSWNRFIRGAEQTYGGIESTAGLRFAGVDYLLLHNLLVLTTPGAWTDALDPECPPDGTDSSDGDGDGFDDTASDGDGFDDTASDGDTAAGTPKTGCGCAATSVADGPSGFAALLLALIGVRRRDRTS